MSFSAFICRDDFERAWQMDLHRRIEPVMRMSCGIVLVAFVLASPWLNAWSALPTLLATASFGVASALVNRLGRLDPVVYAWFGIQALIATVGVMNAQGHPGTLGLGLMLLLWPLAGAAGGFPTRLVALCVAYTCAIYAGAVLAIEPALIAHDPPRLIWPLSMFVALSVISTAVRHASMEHRAASVFDPLTGLLNRAALQGRAAELEHQAEVTVLGVAVIVLDLDRFKQVNDLHGHETGDAVLQEAAYRWRKVLGPFDLIYRFGGEEFVVLLPGIDGRAATARAEELCAALRAEPIAGLAITTSAGVASSVPPEAFQFASVFSRADGALYAAKHSGRDRVVNADEPVPALQVVGSRGLTRRSA